MSKRYTKFEDTPALLTSLRHALRRTRRSRLWAVRDLDLAIDPGECVGLIGRNGSGKSTTLQMLCGVTAPSSGEVRVRGRIAPLISVGVGFHPELTGRENVIVNGSILGMSRREIASKMESIVDFSGVEEFLDTPIKFYSSGMTVRLGFSVAAHADPEVLLVDEVLAVGDLSFQVRSFDRMLELRETGTTIVVVSHALHAVERLCARTVVLDGGRCVYDGQTRDAISAYHDVLAAADDSAGGGSPEALRHESGVVSVTRLQLCDRDGQATAHVESGRPLVVRLELSAEQHVTAPFATVTVRSLSGVVVYTDNNLLEPFPALEAGQVAAWSVEIDTDLATGSYAVSVSVARTAGGEALTTEQALADIAILAAPAAAMFYVAGRPFVHGVADLHARFTDGARGPAA